MVDALSPLVVRTSNHLIIFWRTANAVAQSAKDRTHLKTGFNWHQLIIMNKGKIRSWYTENNIQLVTALVLHRKGRGENTDLWTFMVELL